MFRIAILANGPRVRKTIHDLLGWIGTQPDIELVAAIVHVHPGRPESSNRLIRSLVLMRTLGMYKALSRIAFSLIIRVEAWLLRGSPLVGEHQRLYSIPDTVDIIRITPRMSASGFVYRFDQREIERIRALDLDLLVLGGGVILKGDILRAARRGILSFHYADNRLYRGSPAAFWEILERRPTTGFIVQRLTEELDGGDVVARGAISTDFVFLRNRAALYERANPYMHKAIREVLEQRETVERSLPYDGPLYRNPELPASLAYAARTLAQVTRRRWRRLRPRGGHWGVAYAWSHWTDLVMWRAQRLRPPAGGTIAEPFVLARRDAHYVFVRAFFQATRKGVIACYRLDHAGATALGTVLEEPCQLSFPFVFDHAGETYMVPSRAAGDIALYRASAFPRGWERIRTLVQGVNAVGTMLFEHHGRWWMLTTVAAVGVGVNDAELLAFHADSPLGEWTPHPANPLIVDAALGLSGGLLRDGDLLYRVVRRPAFGTGGRGLAIDRIDRLDETTFATTRVGRLEPRFFAGARRTHHLHSDGGLTVFDYLQEGHPP